MLPRPFAEFSNDERLERRPVESSDTFIELQDWIAELHSNVLPKSAIGKAIG